MIKPYINYFNLKLSHWEPLMDPWEFAIHVRPSVHSTSPRVAHLVLLWMPQVTRSVTTGLLSVDVSSRKRLELNITSTFIELVLTTMSIMNREGGKVFTTARGSNAPFLLKNRTGYPLCLWGENGEAEAAAQRLEDGEETPWRFDDWRRARENLGANAHNSLTVVVEGTNWDRLKHIYVDREGEHIHPLRPRVNKVTHRLLCDVKLVDNVKIVTFRSTFLVQNKTLVNAELVVVDEHGKKSSQVFKIRQSASSAFACWRKTDAQAPFPSSAPGGDCAVPILSAYHDRIKLRPDRKLASLKQQ